MSVASLGLMSPGAVTDSVTLFVTSKSDEPFLLVLLQTYDPC